MLRVCLLAVLLLAVPAAAFCQPWADAVRTGDYEKAAALLQPIVSRYEYSRAGDPAPARQLAVMYADGLGVAPDPVAACALAHSAALAVEMSAGAHPDPRQWAERYVEAREFAGGYCQRLSPEDQRRAADSMGCYAFGLTPGVLQVGPHAVRLDRVEVKLDAQDGAGEPLVCTAAIAGVTTRTVMPPADAAPGLTRRHFLELFAWRVTGALGQPHVYSLQWDVYEVSEHGIARYVSEPLATTTTWPGPGTSIPGGMTTEMIPSGHVRWMIPGRPPRRGWIMRREEKEP